MPPEAVLKPTSNFHTNNSRPRKVPWVTWANLNRVLAPGDTIQTQGLLFHPADTNLRLGGGRGRKTNPASVKVRSEGRTVRFDDTSECEGDTEEVVFNETAKDAAEGKAGHFGIVLRVDDEYVYLAATCTFHGRGELRDEHPIVRVGSLPYFLPVSPATKEKECVDGKTYETGEPVSKIAGDPRKRSWIYVRWASKIRRSDTSLMVCPTEPQERFGADVVKIIEDEIEKHERKRSG